MNPYLWLDAAEVRALHLELLAEHGGSPGIRDLNLLESAIARPLNQAAYGSPSMADLAAAYAFGIARNHPFVDGNKRTAFAAAAVFLLNNGWELVAPQEDALDMMLGLASGAVSESAFAAWIAKSIEPAASEQ